MRDALVILAALALAGCSGGNGGSSGSTGTSTSTTSGSGSTGGQGCDAGLGEGQVQGWPDLTSVRATRSYTYVFPDGGADASRLEVTLDAYHLPPGCGTTISTSYKTFRLTVDTTTGGGAGPGLYAVDDGGAHVRYEFSGDSSGGAQDAARGAITLASVGGTGVSGSFEADLGDLVLRYPDGGAQQDRVTGTFSAVPSGVISE